MENINLLGIGLDKMEQQMFENEYGLIFSNEVISKNVIRLTNQLWKLIPMKENEEDWRKQLDTVLLEIIGLKELFISNPLFLQLIAKLKGLSSEDIEFSLYRKTVFEAINLLQELKK